MTMTEGTVVRWLVRPGAAVAPGDGLVEIETTKVVNELEATAGGVVHRVLVEANATVPVGSLLGVIAEGHVSEAEIDAFVDEFAITTSSEAADVDRATAPRRLDIGGRAINVLALGTGDGLPALLLHGLGGDIDGWRFTQPALGEDRAVWALDLPGHGDSTVDVGDGSVATLADLVMSVLDTLEIERAHIAGHSLGGAVALAVLATAPQRVASLSLIASCGLGNEIDTGALAAILTAGRRRAMKEALSRLFADPESVRREMVEDMLGQQRTDGVLQAREAIMRACFADGHQRAVLRDVLSVSSVPAQAIWGHADGIVPPAHADGLPAAVAVHRLRGAGHMPHVEQAGAVNRLLAELMRAADTA